MPYTFSNDKSIYYEIQGSGQPLLLLSPLGCEINIWDNLMSLLVMKFQVIRMDYRGSGQSDKPYDQYTNEKFVQDVLAVLNAAKIEKVHVVGHDMGGMIAEYFASIHPEKVISLVLAGTFSKISEHGVEYLEQQLKLAETKPDEVDVIKWQQLLGVASQPLHAFIRQTQYCLHHDASAILPTIEARTLVITGSDDELVTAKGNYDLTATLPNARSVLIDGVGHMLQMEAPDEFAKHIMSFCRSNE